MSAGRMYANHPYSAGLGRLFVPDPRDHAAAGVLRQLDADILPMPLTRYWSTPRSLPLDQGDSPMCVAYAALGALLTGPVKNRAGLPAVDAIYHNAQLLDGIPGEDYDGTTARGAMKYLQQQGYLTRYVWAWDVPTIERWVATQGPMLLGVNWYTSFDRPDVTTTQQTLRITPAATIRGGHEFLVLGVDRPRERLRCLNSWGVRYAARGRFWLPYATLERLLAEDGDAVTPTEVLKAS